MTTDTEALRAQFKELLSDSRRACFYEGDSQYAYPHDFSWFFYQAGYAAAKAEAADVGDPPSYMLAKLRMVMPLFQEARDALTAITETQRKLHGISPTLADRMDDAGTFSLDDWQAGARAKETSDEAQ